MKKRQRSFIGFQGEMKLFGTFRTAVDRFLATAACSFGDKAIFCYMLLSTMNDRELTKAVWLDYATILKSSTIDRLHQEYDRERRKKKIPPEDIYSRCYSIRTRAKNNWMIFLQKESILPKYLGQNHIVFCCIVYYFGPKGYTVFKPDDNAKLLFVYQAHVFTRYCQRMQLPFTKPLEKIHHFFTYNSCSEHQVTARKDRMFSVGVCRDGALLGDYREDIKWVFNKTFVNRGVYYRYQEKAEHDVQKQTTDLLKKALAGKVSLASVYNQASIAHAIFCS